MEPVKIAKRKVEVDLGVIGYEGNKVLFWMNPSASIYDQYMKLGPTSEDTDEVRSQKEQEEWEFFIKTFVLDWNLADEDGQVLPKNVSIASLPRKLTNYLVGKWFQLFREESELPKDLYSNLGSTLRMDTSDQRTESTTQSQENTSQSSSPTDSTAQAQNIGRNSTQPVGSTT